MALSVWEATEYLSGRGGAHRPDPPTVHRALSGDRCSDGYITLGAATDRLFERLCGVLGHPEWARRPSLRTGETRRRPKTLAALIEGVTCGAPRRHWLDLFDANEIPGGPINDYDRDAGSADPARGMVARNGSPDARPARTLGSPLKMSGTPTDATRRARPGRAHEGVLLESGYRHRDRCPATAGRRSNWSGRKYAERCCLQRTVRVGAGRNRAERRRRGDDESRRHQRAGHPEAITHYTQKMGYREAFRANDEKGQPRLVTCRSARTRSS
jgi:hypothetical protein